MNDKVVYVHMLSGVILNAVYSRLAVTHSLKTTELTDEELEREFHVVWQEWSHICKLLGPKVGLK